TGVQTCALPISERHQQGSPPDRARRTRDAGRREHDRPGSEKDVPGQRLREECGAKDSQPVRERPAKSSRGPARPVRRTMKVGGAGLAVVLLATACASGAPTEA